MLRTVVATVCLCIVDAAFAAPVPLSGQSLSEMIAGSVVDLDTPLGTKLTITYGGDGRMNGQAGALAFYLGASRDKGKWWVASDQLCQKWEKWFDAETQCMRIKKDGPRIHWASRDGKTGTGTVHLRVAAAAEGARTAPRPVAGKAVTALVPVPPAKPPRAIISALPSPAKPADKPVEKVAEVVADEAVAVAASTASGIAVQEAAPAAQPMPQFSRLRVPFFAPVDMAKFAVSGDSAVVEPAVGAGPVAASVLDPSPAPTPAPAVETKRRVDAKPVPQTVAKQVSAVPVEPMFKVVNVRSSDVLNVREGPSWERDVVGAIPPGGRGVAVTGECRSQWCPVRHLDLRGWVNRTYLESENGEIVVSGGGAPGVAGDSPDAPRGCLSSAAKELLGRIEAKFGPMQLVSTCRSGATVAGTGKPSRHRDGNAIDFKAGARKQAVVDWLVANHTQGGTMTYRDMEDIHIDIGPHFLALGSGGRSGRDWSAGRMGVTSAR